MKKSINIIILFLIISFIWTGCNKDETIEYPNTPPVVTLGSDVIEGIRGRDIIITGSLRDDFGLNFITFTSPGINLNPTIAISSRKEILETFEFSHTHRIPANTVGNEFIVLATCKNLTGQVTEVTFTVILP